MRKRLGSSIKRTETGIPYPNILSYCTIPKKLWHLFDKQNVWFLRYVVENMVQLSLNNQTLYVEEKP